MTFKVCLLTLCLCLVHSPFFAQSSNWKKNLKTANQLYSTGKYAEAADFFVEVYKQNGKSKNYLAQAAQCYEKARLYSQAAKFYEQLQPSDQYPLAGFKYAQALKQSGDYDAAISAFKSFLVNYKGSDTKTFIKLVKNEVAGCEMALSTSNKTSSDLIVEHLSENVNTMMNEYGPLPFNDAVLYFSSTVDNYSKIYRSQFHGGDWTKAVLPTFPDFENMHVGNGSFTPDNKRFYFTVCQGTTFTGVDAPCDIHVTVLKDGAWSKPKKLREYIKLEGTTATHPYVVHEGEMEIIYFSSNRKGGQGGMDIWYMTRHIDSPEYDFTLPKNAGKQINTPADEVSPYYDLANSTLYFSSNGHAGLGGYDVFQALGSMNKFSEVANLEQPINSQADDYYYTKNSSGTGGFFVSNRTFGNDKISTSDDDIFSFSTPEQRLMVQGNIYDKSNNSIVTDVQILLYELVGNGQKKRLLQSIIANNGTYQFVLMPERQFQIEAIKEGFETAGFDFDTYNADPAKEYGRAIYLESDASDFAALKKEAAFNEVNSTASIDKVINSTPEVEEADLFETNRTATAPKETNTSEATYINSYYNGMEVTTSAPKLDGVYYKVQISTAAEFNEYNTLFDSIRDLGRLQTELISAKNWTRILLSEYYSLDEARRVMDESRANGFPQSFVVKYRNGKRLN